MVCPGCEGRGCEECKNTGGIDITECPLNLITNDVWQVIRFTELFEKGLPPVAGGTLDQTMNFIETAMFVMSETAYWKKKLGILD